VSIVDKYNNILNLKPQYTDFTIRAYIPNPTETDYKRRYITRYFVQKANDPNSPIFEVDSDVFSAVSNNPYYIGVDLDWSIIGDSDTVKKSNTASISIASKTLKSISLYLPNLLQFWKK
jgi:hypothetical protein